MMRKPVVLLLVVLSVLLVGIGVILWLQDAPLQPPAALTTPLPSGESERVSVQELHARLQGPQPPLVWEFRSPESYAQQHVPGSRLMSLDEIAASAAPLDRSQPIVTLCA